MPFVRAGQFPLLLLSRCCCRSTLEAAAGGQIRLLQLGKSRRSILLLLDVGLLEGHLERENERGGQGQDAITAVAQVYLRKP